MQLGIVSAGLRDAGAGAVAEACATAPRLTTLDVNASPEKLLESLMGDVAPEELLCARHDYKGLWQSVHSHVLASAITSGVPSAMLALIACCKRLIEVGAPLTDTLSISGDGAGMPLCSHFWPTEEPLSSLTKCLAECYVDAGLWDIEQPLPGELQSKSDYDANRFPGVKGMKPLASAVFFNESQVATWLCEQGASLMLGPVYAGGPAANALDLALELGHLEVHAVLATALMERQMAAAAVAAVPHNTSASRRTQRSRL